MNNQFLCKARRIDWEELPKEQQWVQGNVIYDGVTGQYFMHALGNSVNESDKVGEKGCLSFVAYEIDAETICRCTGREDEWEHDVFYEDDAWYEIVFCEESLTWDVASVFGYESIELGEFDPEKYIKLGNSIENPELLDSINDYEEDAEL